MLELKVKDLTVGDEYTQDQGDTWWKVIANDHERSAVRRRRVMAECVGSQVPGIVVGDVESGVYDATDLVIVR